MLPRFTPLTLLALVAAFGLAATVWYAFDHDDVPVNRALQCRSNQRLIDRFVATWELRNGLLDADRGDLFLALDDRGTIVHTSVRMVERMASVVATDDRLVKGSNVLARIGRDDLAFRCPEPLAPGAVSAGPEGTTYRWMLSGAPLRELGGRTRGASCVLHEASHSR